MWNARLDESQTGIKIARRNINNLAFHMMYSVYKLNKQFDNIQLWCTPFPILNWSVVPCKVLTVASLPTYRFLRRQVRWSGIPISLRIFHSLLEFTVEGFCVVNGAKVDVFLEFSCFFYDPTEAGNFTEHIGNPKGRWSWSSCSSMWHVPTFELLLILLWGKTVESKTQKCSRPLQRLSSHCLKLSV